MNSVSFKANFADNSFVKARQLNGRYDDKQISLVKVSHSEADKNSMYDVFMRWNAGYAESILIDYFWEPVNKNLALYALTEQLNNYEKLQPEKVLGLVEVKDNSDNYKINYIQVRSDCICSKRDKSFCGIGTALMKYVINLAGDKNIYLNSVKKAIDFYTKFGFKVIQDDLKEPLMILRKSVK